MSSSVTCFHAMAADTKTGQIFEIIRSSVEGEWRYSTLCPPALPKERVNFPQLVVGAKVIIFLYLRFQNEKLK